MSDGHATEKCDIRPAGKAFPASVPCRNHSGRVLFLAFLLTGNGLGSSGATSRIDAALVASLVVMVIISGYENFVSRFDQADDVHWLGTIDAGSLKIKVASTIVAISSIHLLQVFLNLTKYTTEQLTWFTVIHLAFVFSALFLAYIDKIMAKDKGGKKSNEPSI